MNLIVNITEIIDAKLIHGLGRGMMLEIRCDNDTRFGQKVFNGILRDALLQRNNGKKYKEGGTKSTIRIVGEH